MTTALTQRQGSPGVRTVFRAETEPLVSDQLRREETEHMDRKGQQQGEAVGMQNSGHRDLRFKDFQSF